MISLYVDCCKCVCLRNGSWNTSDLSFIKRVCSRPTVTVVWSSSLTHTHSCSVTTHTHISVLKTFWHYFPDIWTHFPANSHHCDILGVLCWSVHCSVCIILSDDPGRCSSLQYRDFTLHNKSPINYEQYICYC